MQKLFSVKEALQVLKISEPTLRRIILSGDLQTVRIGTGNLRPRVLITETALEDFINRKSIFTGRNGK